MTFPLLEDLNLAVEGVTSGIPTSVMEREGEARVKGRTDGAKLVERGQPRGVNALVRKELHHLPLMEVGTPLRSMTVKREANTSH